MSVERFITELEQRDLLSERQLAKLREASTEKQMSAKTLAKFLVQKSLLSQQQATDLLNTVQLGGGDLDATSKQPVSPGPVQIGIVDDSIPQLDDDPESSSIFASYLAKPEVRTSQISSTEADEFMLVPDELEAEPDEAPRRRERSSRREEEVEILPDEKPAGLKQLAATERRRPKVAKSAKQSKLGGDDKPKKARTLKKKKTWDSPLMLLGGGGLLLMLLAGGLVWWLMIRESADQKLTLARAAMDQGAYTKAIEHYEDFITSAPSHPEHDIAQVQIVLLRIRQATEAGDFEQALDRAENDLKKAEDNEKFDEAHGELAALLPQIAMGLAKQTEKSDPGSAEAAKSAELATKALELCNNVTYVPKTLRDEGKLTAVRDTLQLVERRNQTKVALNETLKSMQESLAAGDTSKAYTAYRQLLRTHQDLAENASLAEMLQKTMAAEQAAIQFKKDEQPAETFERPTPWVASLAVANRRVKPTATIAPTGSTPTTIACVRIDGALYGLEVATGKLLWRRYVGPGSAWPQFVHNDNVGSSVLVADTRHQELLLLDASTGRLQWRQTIGEPIAQPLILGTRTLVAAKSGRLYAIDMKTGHRAGYVQFAQPLRVAPSVSANAVLYLVGDHSTVYALKAIDLSCVGVFYLGHSEGSITKSPAAVMDKVALVENDGATTSRLRLLSVGEDGAIVERVGERRLTGLTSASPLIAGRQLIVVTDRGQIDVYDVGGEGEKAITPVATRVATGSSPLIRYAARSGRNIWIGDTQLTKFSILPTGNRLPVEAIENDFVGSTFDHPLQVFGDTVVHVRRAKGRSGAIVSATAMAQGNTLWEIDLATPPAGAPVVDESAKEIVVANADGALFRFNETAIKSRIQYEPLTALDTPNPRPALTASVELGQGRAAFCAPDSDQLLMYNPSLGAAAARWIKLDSPLACDIASLGQTFVAPLSIGQVFLLSAADGSKLAAPFQTLLEPQKEWRFTPAGVVDADANTFVIADGEGTTYLIDLANEPTPHLRVVAKAESGSQSVESRPIVLGNTAIVVAGSSHLVRFELPSMQPVGEANLPAPVVWGPHRVGDVILLATANNELMAIGADGKVKWKAPVEHGDLAGAPLEAQNGFLIAYRKGILERRTIADGKAVATGDVEQPLAAGPVFFLQRLLLVANDGTLLVVDQP